MTSFQLNGKPVQVDAAPEMPLLWALRDRIGATGTKYACGAGICGACTVHLDGTAVRSCITPLSAVAGKKVMSTSWTAMWRRPTTASCWPTRPA